MLVATAVPSLFSLSQVVKAVVSGSFAADVSVPSMAKRKQVQLPAASHAFSRIGMSRLSLGSKVVCGTLPLPPWPLGGRPMGEVSDELALQPRSNARLEASSSVE